MTVDQAQPVVCTRHKTIRPIAAEWDGLVPRDVPHLRAGFLRAAEKGDLVQQPNYLLARQGDRPVAAAVAYTLLMDTMTTAPPRVRHVVERIRRKRPKFMWRPMLVCGSPISNAESGFYFHPELTAELRRQIFRSLTREVEGLAGFRQAIFFKDFKQDEVTEYASDLQGQSYFPVDPWAGTRMELHWDSFDAYLAALNKRYRRRIKKDLENAGDLEFHLLDSFAHLASRAAELYMNVLARAPFTLEKATPEFFAALSDFEQARLLVARPKNGGDIVGFNLLLFGDACMHNLYIGFDYDQNEKYPIYFSLVEHSLRLALERKCRVCYFGQDSYEFKARLGATPVPLTAYMKHRLWPIHLLLRSSRETIFPKNEAVAHDVFQSGKGSETPELSTSASAKA